MIFFDTDCLSAFLWVKEEHLLVSLNLGQLVLPRLVHAELSNPSVRHLGKQVDKLINGGHMRIMEIMTGTEEERLFRKMTTNPVCGLVPIGRGEAAALVLAKAHDGVVASNNLKDIGPYIARWGLRRMPTDSFSKYYSLVYPQDEAAASSE